MLSLAVALSAGCSRSASKQTEGELAPGEKITIMVGGLEKQIYLPAKLTEQLGYFKDAGLNVELVSTPAGVEAENELLAGAAQGAVSFYDHTIDLQAKGKFIESVVQFSSVPGEVELVSSKQADRMHSAADFRGKNVGVTGLGSSTNFLTQYLAARQGVKSSEMTVIPVGAGNTFVAAMQQGKIDVGMTTEPTVSQMLKRGDARVLIDLRTPEGTRASLGGLYPAACLYMQTSWVESHKVTARKIANAFVRTLRFIATHDAQEIAEKMPREYYADDKDGYVKALAAGKAMFVADGRMPAGGPETVLAVLVAFNKNVKGATIDLSKTYTSELLDAAAE